MGRAFMYHDVQKGDEVTVQHYVSLTRVADSRYELRTNTDVTVVPPNGAAVRFADRSGRMQLAVEGRIPRRELPSGAPAEVHIGG